ncbi:MAG TPA: NAD(P)H-dependent oxidoreductase [Stellaceae bacterium]|jgi:chromate reductase|nr:NAD(P)H-dependent oxidoreductase [Stellaceae bacterium]
MADTPIKVLALSGSLRKGSYNTMLLHAAKEVAPAGMSIDIYDLAPIPMYNDDVRLGPGYPAEVQAFRDAIAAHDAVLFASPEYNYSVSGVLKNAIDWASRAPNMPFDGKTGAIVGASGGALGTARSQRDLRWIMSGLNMYVVNLPHVYVGGAAQKFADGKLTDQGARDFIKQLLENLADLTLRLRPR